MSRFRTKYGDAAGPPLPGVVTERARFATAKIVERNFSKYAAGVSGWVTWNGLLEYLRAHYKPVATYEHQAISGLINALSWPQFYEAVEYIALKLHAMPSEIYTSAFKQFRADVNAVWQDEAIAYAITHDGEVTQRVSAEFVEASSTALDALARAGLDAEEQQLVDAHAKLKLRQLDPAGAVLIAVGALENTARHVLGVTSGNLASNKTRLGSVLHPTLVNALVSLEAFRGACDRSARREGCRQHHGGSSSVRDPCCLSRHRHVAQGRTPSRSARQGLTPRFGRSAFELARPVVTPARLVTTAFFPDPGWPEDRTWRRCPPRRRSPLRE